jgi:DnaA family protein
LAQLPLKLALADYARFETFVAGGSTAAVEHLQATAAGAADSLWLWGPVGCGKTHLLQAACRAASVAGRRAMYVRLDGAEAALLAGLENVDLLALDDVDRVAGDATWERALFVIVNEFLPPRGGLLLAATTSAAGCGFRLPDLASRAAGAVSYRLKPLEDGERALALRLHAEARGLELEPAAAEYLLKRVERGMPALAAWLDRLDRESLIEQRRLTIPFIRERLANGPASDE